VSEVRSLPDAVYRAEDAVLGPVSRQFSTMAEIREFVTDLTLSDWWQTEFKAAPLGVVVETRSSSAVFALGHADGMISIPNNPNGRKLSTVLHELAHVATVATDGHGPIFRGAMIQLVRREMGLFAAVDLENEYRNKMRGK
jgi:putative metallohydrolase (TIGR04338 family)